jgi:thiol-disulfide isomerase/thioredoxin
MNSSGARIFGAAMVVLLGVWVGVKMHLIRGTSHVVAVPAGMASAPNSRDLAASAGDGALAADGASAARAALPVAHTVPLHLPDFSLQDLSGKPTAISAWAGKSLVINFWATWCAPCRREIPLLKSISADWAARDLKVIGIAVDYRDKVQEFAGQFKIDYPVLVGEQDALDVAAKLGMDAPAFPFTVFTDRRGEVVALFVGELHRPQADFILSEVQNLNQDRLSLPEARRAIAEGLKPPG